MTALPMADRIPFELWLRIFNNLTLTELLPIMSVCSVWRQVVFACNQYSSLILLESTTDTAINFFLLRLERSRFRLTEAIVAVEQACDAIPTRILPALKNHLDHLVGLAMNCNSHYGEQIMELVRNPAPRLQDLAIMLNVDSSCTSPTALHLPGDTLQRSPCDLRHVALRNVHLPLSGMIPAFANVGTLIVAFSNGLATELDQLWPCFPSLRDMVVSGPVILSPGVYSHHQAWRSLRHLDVRMEAECAADFFLRAPLRDISTIRVSYPDELLIGVCLRHLDGKLEMTCWHDGDGTHENNNVDSIVAIAFTDSQSGRTRIFIRPFTQWFVDKPASDCLRSSNITERIAILSLPDGLCVPIFQFLPPLDNLTSLRIFYHQNLTLPQDVRYSFCPNLARLTLRSDMGATLSSSELRKFIQMALLPLKSQYSPQIYLVLDGVDMSTVHDDDVLLFREILKC